MKTIACLFAVCAAVAHGQTSTAPVSSVTMPPLPPTPAPVDIGNQLIPPAKKLAAIAAHEEWKRSKGGAEFFSGLTFVGGRPVLMIISDQNENPATVVRRKGAIVSACEFLLDAAAFDTISISIVETAGKGPNAKPNPNRNTSVARHVFEAAARTAGKSSDLKIAIAATANDEAAVHQICAQIGVR